jgi:two-component system OmpR family response regulator
MAITKVLLIDDEPHIRKIGQISLARVGGYEVLLAASGPEGLALAVSARPDVILLDVMMAGMDGPMTLAELRARPETAHIPVLFMTASAQGSEISRYRSLGAAGVIGKPFDPMTLPAQIAALVGEARAS